MVAGRPLRIAIFGTPEFAVPTLAALLGSPHHVVAAVTQPDRPRGRGHHTSAAPVKAHALSAGLPILQPDRLKDQGFLDALAALDLDLGVVAAYGRILPQAVLDVPRLGMINVHASLLPRYRGAAPVHRAVIDGEAETGVTIMRVVLALDAGPMLSRARRPIGPDETSVEVERDLARIGAGLLVTAVDELAAGPARETPQDDAQATYAPRITREEGAIDWTLPAARIHNLVRGLHPWPHAFSFLDGRRIILLRSTRGGGGAHAEPGTIEEAAGDRLRIATGGGHLDILELQLEGRRPMSVRELLAGHPLAPGARFARHS